MKAPSEIYSDISEPSSARTFFFATLEKMKLENLQRDSTDLLEKFIVTREIFPFDQRTRKVKRERERERTRR